MKRAGFLFLVVALVGIHAQAATFTVVVNGGLQFTPAKVTVSAGDTVEFVNQSDRNHTVTADPTLVEEVSNVILPEGAKPFHSGRLTPGQKFQHVFSQPGLYQYVCLPHEHMGMMGQVQVNAARDLE